MPDMSIKVFWDEECIRSSIYRELVQGIKRSAAKSQYSVDIYSDTDELLRNSRHDQIIIVIGYESPKLQQSISAIIREKKHVVLAGLDGDRFGNKVSSVSPSRAQATAQLLQYLMDCGRKSIAMVGVDRLSVNDMMRCDTFKTILRANGHPAPEKNIFYFQNDLYGNFDAFSLRREEFDAVMCPNDYTALCFLRFCQDKGIRIPEDVYLTAFSNRLVSKYCTPSITTMAVDFCRVGEHAVFAWQFLREHEKESLHIQLTTPGILLARESTEKEDHPFCADNTLVYDTRCEGGLFYSDPTIQAVMRIENCLASCDKLDLQIIRSILDGESYEAISEKLFVSRSGLNYHLRRIYPAAHVSNRKDFERLFRQYFTYKNHIGLTE